MSERLKITKSFWLSLPAHEKRSHKNGKRFVLTKNTGNWVEVYWLN